MSENTTFRPIPISQIKNNTIRRILIIVFFIPITIIAWVVHLIRGIWWIILGIPTMPVALVKSGIKHWNTPLALNDDKE